MPRVYHRHAIRVGGYSCRSPRIGTSDATTAVPILGILLSPGSSRLISASRFCHLSHFSGVKYVAANTTRA
ncbi:hypothetical protein GUJ93_ZPchr0004g40489 [Zizania palustris]|uniref:Uncharacterized protein n=1 Tax=Zizania palustris TaxID=103762 RepID=A0A8J5VF91_ZIZPA|nr:hypothetical protein GUJ93_ZPchr0004g40489 [Zizania palustris]KAG8064455.1 hypothetical protein GUJ93_ZPchr0004g40489 [Zizania palustris]